MPLAFTVALCNENNKKYFKPLLEEVHSRSIRFEAVAADAQYNSAKMREVVEAYGAEPVIPARRDSRVSDALKGGRNLVVSGARRLIGLFRKRWSIEQLFSRAKEWLMLDGRARRRNMDKETGIYANAESLL